MRWIIHALGPVALCALGAVVFYAAFAATCYILTMMGV